MAAAPDVSQSAAAQWTCLPLAKFSYATSLSEHDAYINWVHLPQRDNLFVVFDTIRIRLSGNRYEERKVLKVVCGSDILEHLDLNEMVQERREAEARFGSSQLHVSQLPIAAIVQSPCIAIRYKMSTGQTRRFQLRCTAESAYNSAVDILKQVGLPLKESVPQRSTAVPLGPPIRPASSSSQGRPSSSASQARLVSSRGTYTAASPLASQVYYNSDSGNSKFDGLPHRQPSAVAYGNQARSSTTGPEKAKEPSNPLSLAYEQSPNMHRRSPPGLQDELRPFPLAHPRYLDGKSNPEFLADRPSTSSGLSQGARPFMEDFTASNPMPPPTERLGTTSLSYNPGSTEAVNQQRPGSNTLQRPATAPMSQAETLTQLLPPKRELPFGKPFSKDTLSSTNPIVKRGISVLDLPPLPTPTIVENPKLPSTATPSSTKKNMPAPRSRKKPSPRAKSNAKGKAQATQSLKETPVGEAPEKGSMQYPLLASKTVPQIETLDSVGTPSRTLRTLGDATSNSRQNDPKPPLLGLNQQASSNAIQFAPSSSVNIVSDASPTVPVNPTDEEWMDRVDAFVARHAARLPPMQAKDLSAYAAQSDEERMAQIDNMICDYIKDPNFVKLCEDVENSWRRIAGDY